MENDHYKEVFDVEEDRIYKNSEIKVKKILLNFKGKGKVFSPFYNRLLSVIYKLETEKYYINISGKFNNILAKFKSHYGYDSDNSYKLYSTDMYDDFKRIKGVKKNYTYIEFLKELAKIKTYERVYRTSRKYYDTYRMMYDFNDFSKFKFWDYSGNENRHPVYLEFYERKYPSPMKDENEIPNYNFLIKNEFRETFKNLYIDLTVSFINEKLTSQEDFENVFLLKNKEHKSKIHFFGDTEPVAYLLRELEFFFKELSYTNIADSELLISKRDKELRQKNLSNSLTAFKNKVGDNLTDSIIQEVRHILNKIK